MKRATLLIAAVCLVIAGSGWAQDTTRTEIIPGTSTATTQTVSGTVLYVAGNDLVIKLDDGQVKHYTAPPGASAMVDGKEITIKDVVPGVRLTRTITTTETPRTVETVRTIKGTLWFVSPPYSVILSLPEGNKQYRVPEGQKFTIDGQSGFTVWDLKKGMTVEATVVKSAPETVVTASKSITAKLPPPPPATPEVQGALLIEEAVAEVAEMLPPALPQTGSLTPALAFVGLVLTTASLVLRLVRT